MAIQGGKRKGEKNMFGAYSKRGSHRRMVVRSLKNRKAILIINQNRKCIGIDSEEYAYYMYINKPNRNRALTMEMDYSEDVPGSMNSTGWKTSTKRKKQWKYPRPSSKELNAAFMEIDATSED